MVAVMAILFEGAKVAITMYLLAHWCWRLLPLALAGALVLLTTISSLGVYGTLGRAYNEGRGEAISTTTGVVALTANIHALELDRDRIYHQIEAIPGEHSTNRRRVMAQMQPQLEQITRDMLVRRAALLAAQQAAAVASNDIGDLKYASMLFKVSQDQLAMFIITTLAFLLDPLALLLLLASGVKAPSPVVAAPVVLEVPRTPNVTLGATRTTNVTLSAVRVPLPVVVATDPDPAPGLSHSLNTLLRRVRAIPPHPSG